MNYVTAVLGIFIIFVTGLWFMKRKTYEGPKLEFILGEELPVVDTPEPQRTEKEVVSSAHSKQEES
ncbi:hypothetical protein ACHAPO_004483 [Fusarium lateritium]